MILTFYSYKGGVGRSMALANVAEIFYQEGLKVLMVDWDLEAPGLDRFYFESTEDIIQNKGLIDLILDYQQTMSGIGDDDFELIDINKYICSIQYNNINGNSLALMHAGKRSGDNFKNFAQKVINFDWQDFYMNWGGEAFFNWLYESFDKLYDVILIDSRTGVTEMGGVCTYQLADTVVMFCAPNHQNIDGTYNMAQNFTSKSLKQVRPERPLNLVIVPARVEDRSELRSLGFFRRRFKTKFDGFLKLIPNISLDSFWELKIPYIAYFSFNECIPVKEKSKTASEDIINAYYKLANVLNQVNKITPKYIFENVKANSNTSSSHNSHNENHLIIGLGGTGGKIIRSFKKTIYQEYREEKPEGVNIEYLYVDSSSELMGASDQTWKILGKSLQLDKRNQCLIEGSILQVILDNINDYPGIKPWIGNRKQWADILTSLTTTKVFGGQKRRLGRFLFANKCDRFVRQVKELVAELRSSREEASVTFHLCCGLAGGTGSGALIDTIYQLRVLYPDPRKFHIIIYALLPDEHPKSGWDTGNYHANGYAALLELNSMSVQRWMPHDISGENNKIQGQEPFNGCYLFENMNENGAIVDVETEMPNIVANFIYMKTVAVKDSAEWMRTLEKIENGENGDATPETTPVEGEKTPERSKRFLTFGIKRLAIPEDEIKEFLTYTFSEQATLKFLYENWQDSKGFIKQNKHIPANELVRQSETRQKWRLTDDHLCLSIGILEDDFKKWTPIEENWTARMPKIKRAAINISDSKRNWVDDLKRQCDNYFQGNYRGAGVKNFYRYKEQDRAPIANEICRIIENDLFENWENSVYSIIDVGVIMDALIADARDRLSQIDATLQTLQDNEGDIEDRINAKDHEWAQTGKLGELLLSKLDRLFDAHATLQEELYITRTRIEAWQFAQKLLPIVITNLETLKGEIDGCIRTMRTAHEQFETFVEVRCNGGNEDEKDYFIRFYEPEKVKELGQRLRVDEDLQRAQINSVRRTILEKLGAEPNFSTFNERIKPQDLIDTIALVCQESAIAAHDNIFAEISSQKFFGVSIIEKLYDRFGNDIEGLQLFLSNLVEQAGNYLTISESERRRRAPGIPNGKTCISNFIAIIPRSEKNAAFISQIEKLLKRSLDLKVEIIKTDKRRNEITLISIMNLFPIRFVDYLMILKRKYDQKIKSNPTRAILELHLEGDIGRHPSILLMSQEETAEKSLPYLLLAQYMGLINEKADVVSGEKQLWLTLPVKSGLNKPSIYIGDSLADAVDKIERVHFIQMTQTVNERLNSKEHFQPFEKRKEVQQKIVAMINAMQNELGPGGETYERFLEAAHTATGILGLEKSNG